MHDAVWTVWEASRRLGLQESTLRKWILRRRIGTCRLGRARRIPTRVGEQLIQDGYREAVCRRVGAADFDNDGIPFWGVGTPESGAFGIAPLILSPCTCRMKAMNPFWKWLCQDRPSV